MSDGVVISTHLTQDQLQIAANRYVTEKGGAAIAVPVIIGGTMCYINDQITKWRFIKECRDKGGTPVADTTGMCGFWASYRCENLPPPPEPFPRPGIQGPSFGGFWQTSPSGSLIGVTAITNLSVQTFDSDWFGCSGTIGCN